MRIKTLEFFQKLNRATVNRSTNLFYFCKKNNFKYDEDSKENAQIIKNKLIKPKNINNLSIKDIALVNEYFYDTNNNEKTIKQIGKIPIVGRQFKRLKLKVKKNQNCWLHDSIVNGYISILCKINPNYKLINSITFSSLKENVKNKNTDKIDRLLEKVIIKKFDNKIIFLPLNINNYHWILLIYFNNTIFILDSLSNNTSIEEELNIFKKYIIKTVDQKIDTSKIKIKQLKNIPKQTNGYDCGIFVCQYARYFIENKSLGDNLTFTQENIPFFRYEMAKDILLFEY